MQITLDPGLVFVAWNRVNGPLSRTHAAAVSARRTLCGKFIPDINIELRVTATHAVDQICPSCLPKVLGPHVRPYVLKERKRWEK